METSGADWSQILAALTPFLLAGLLGLGWLYRHERERRTSVEEQLSQHKYRTYVELLSIFFDQFKAARSGKTGLQDEIVERMFDAAKDLVIYGSDEVVIAYEEWLEKTRVSQDRVLRGFGEVVVEIRRDMGHGKTRVTSDHVLRLFITEYEEAKAQGLI